MTRLECWRKRLRQSHAKLLFSFVGIGLIKLGCSSPVPSEPDRNSGTDGITDIYEGKNSPNGNSEDANCTVDSGDATGPESQGETFYKSHLFLQADDCAKNPEPPGGGPGQLSAEEILQLHCFNCHGSNGSNAAGLGNILDFNNLIDKGIVVPGSPQNSPLIERVKSTTNRMPPANLPGLNNDQILILEQWITTDLKAPQPPAPPPIAKLFTPDQEFTAALADLDDIAQLSPNDAKFKRYFSFAHLDNAGLTGSLRESYINSLSRFVNSLSDNRRIVQPQRIDGNVEIYRIDIRDYGWTLDDWEALVDVYPYAALQQSEARRESFQDLADTSIPIVRADWFVFQASLPESYHRFLEIPRREADLQRTLGLDTVQNLRDQIDGNGGEASTVLRSGFLNSGVALNNRVIERHDSLFGSYWVSYDFREPNINDADEVAAKDIFTSPLGPLEDLGGDLTFDHDGGEIIFSLPNGLHGFMLINNVGNRIDIGPQDVVADPDRPEGVINGYSCMTCHAGGLIDKPDEVRRAISGNAGFNINERLLIEQLYVESSEFTEAIRQDNETYRLALERASINPDGQNHVVIMATQYDRNVALATVAAEFGLTSDEFLLRLQGSDDDLRRKLGGLSSSSTIGRRTLEGLIEQIVDEFFPSAQR